MRPDISALRAQFPALHRPATPDGTLPVHFDNPAGTQVPQRVIDAVSEYYLTMNANHGGVFATSQRNDAMERATRAIAADFLNAASADEIVIGPNMTTLNFGLSRAIARTLQAGDEIVVTRMDHDANIAPWMRIADDHGLALKWADFDVETGKLDLRSLEAALSPRTRVVATVHASNALGTINPVAQIAALAHEAGAYHVVDAVQSAPHIPIDVQAIGCDFLLCSAYKFFGPHVGLMYGRAELLASLPAYKVRPASDAAPYRWETGTPSYETWYGTAAALEYLAEIGATCGADYAARFPGFEGRRLHLKTAMAALTAYERELVTRLIAGLQAIEGLHIYGITDPAEFEQRVPTVIFTLEGYSALEVAQHLAKQYIYVWDGNYYALAVMERLGLEGSGGAVRVGLAHYNTPEEVDRLLAALAEL
ncbi:MAG: cysteine desulfurase-like protein [Anaerolineae bacterium]|nr:cysteine desulfurase-like protein [Anaerolineae bacterium]